MDIATLGCSANVKLSEDKTVIEDVRIAYGVAGPIPMRAVHAEEAGRGKEVSARILEEIAEQVLFDIHPRDSWRASKAFLSIYISDARTSTMVSLYSPLMVHFTNLYCFSLMDDTSCPDNRLF